MEIYPISFLPKYCTFEAAANLQGARGMILWPRPLICNDAKHLTPGAVVYMCVYMFVCVCAHTEKRAGPTSLARWSLMVDEWHSRCLSIFSSKHPRQAGRRGSWEHEVVQVWTVDFQFNWINWKVKPLWSCQCQPQLWQFAFSDLFAVGLYVLHISTEKYPEFLKGLGSSCTHFLTFFVPTHATIVFTNLQKSMSSFDRDYRKCFW